jgi:lipopolysaccharide transport system permease protein
MESKEWWHAAPYFLAGLAIWEYVKSSVLAGCECFFQNEPYIRQCPLPLAIYPLRTVLGTSIHFLFALGVVLLAITVLHQSGKAFAVLPAVLPALLLLFVFAWSAAVIAAFVTVHFHDVKHLLEVVFQLFFFLTPIMYEKKMLYDKGVGWLADYNPVIVFFDLVRAPMLTGEVPATALYGQAAGIVAVALAAATVLIGRLEKRLIFHL